MSRWSRLGLAVVWALTLVFAAQWGASARQKPPSRGTVVRMDATMQQQPPPGTVISGADLGFRLEGTHNGLPHGTLMVRLNGEWLTVTNGPGQVIPIR